MAEMTERRILVFDGNGLISNVDPFFAGLVLERETGIEPATSTLGRSRSAR